SITLAVSRGATVFSVSHQEIEALGGPVAVAADMDAELVARDRQLSSSRRSLSPASLKTVNSGHRLIFTSLNGAHCTAAAKASPLVLIGALTNRDAVANAIAHLLETNVGSRCTLIACGERWSSVSEEHADDIRPGIEDLLGAGAIAIQLSGSFALSEEANSAVSAFTATQHRLLESLTHSISGRELIAKGFAADIELAAAIDSVSEVAAWQTSDRQRKFVPLAQRSS
ncbi:MAG TPA: 2-phosphosulfolactate phosphatase, partial [Candidatus Nanopelagicaceae bacterium]|nr:2-phosphosulfolactate phosphatase [Candidatus Nanopelagicaceae bacterium]